MNLHHSPLTIQEDVITTLSRFLPSFCQVEKGRKREREGGKEGGRKDGMQA